MLNYKSKIKVLEGEIAKQALKGAVEIEQMRKSVDARKAKELHREWFSFIKIVVDKIKSIDRYE